MAKKTEANPDKKGNKPKTPKKEAAESTDEAAKEVAKEGGMSIGKIISLIIALAAVVIIGGIAYFALSGSAGSAAPLPNFQETNGTVPQQFSAELAQSNSSLNLATLINAQSDSNTQLSVYYSGTISVHEPGSLGVIAPFSSPLTFAKEEYGSSSRSDLNATSVPVIGAVDIQYINSTNGSYICTNFNSTELSNGQTQNLLTNKGTPSCKQGSSIAGLNFGEISQFNFSQLGNLGITLHSQRFYQSIYNDNPCTFVSYIMTQQSQNGTFTGSGQLQMCVSDVNYIPLSVGANMTLTNGGKFFMLLNQTGLNGTASASYINSLPYNLTN